MRNRNRRYHIDTEENRAYFKELAEELLKFGERFPSPGGGSYYLGDDGTPWTGRPRETWITARMVHVYSIGAMLGHEGSAALAEAGLKGLLGELHDPEHGGWYAGVSADGTPLPSKQCYAHAFVILAGCSAHLAGIPGADTLLKNALEIFDRYFWDEKEGLTNDTWNTEFTVLDDYRGLNANMHTVEAFLAVADTLGKEEYRERAGRIIGRVAGWASDNGWRIPEHYTKDWTPVLSFNEERKEDQFKPYGATPGHGIEWARLITGWALSSFRENTGNASYYLYAADQLFRRAYEDGWKSDGAPGIVYTTDWDGKPVVRERMHWVLAEAINTSAVLYHVTGDPYFSDRFADCVLYLEYRMRDRENGSWFHQLDKDNQPSGTVWPGKPDLYHAFQAMLIPYTDPSVSVAAAVKASAVSK